MIGAGSCSALAPLPLIGECNANNKYLKTNQRLYGASAVAWNGMANEDPVRWRDGVQEMYACGLRRVTLVSYAFVNPTTGSVSRESVNNLERPPSMAVLLAAAQEAASLGMEVSVRPWVEIDNDVGAGDVWRGFLSLDGEARHEFTETYGRYVQELALFAKEISASRFYVGSELRGLTSKSEFLSFWQHLIGACKQILHCDKCVVSYAANFNEYEEVGFWDDLDEIGIDAYAPLATEAQSRGAGNPSEEMITKNFERFMQRLKAFSRQLNKPIFISEWGVVPFDTSVSEPSNELPSTIVDRDEALKAYRAVLGVLRTQGNWLQGVDFWHWSIDPYEDSNYRIEPNSDISAVIKSAIVTDL